MKSSALGSLRGVSVPTNKRSFQGVPSYYTKRHTIQVKKRMLFIIVTDRGILSNGTYVLLWFLNKFLCQAAGKLINVVISNHKLAGMMWLSFGASCFMWSKINKEVEGNCPSQERGNLLLVKGGCPSRSMGGHPSMQGGCLLHERATILLL